MTGSGRQVVPHSEFRKVNAVLGHLKTAVTGSYRAFNVFRTPIALSPKPGAASIGDSMKSVLIRFLPCRSTGPRYPVSVLRLAQVC
jgi:hypothetical protein